MPRRRQTGAAPLRGDRALRDDAVPQPVPLQVAELADRRLLLRGPDGVRLLGGVGRDALERVLSAIDGRRTAGEICDQLSDEYDRQDVLDLLRHLPVGAAGTVAGIPQDAASRRAAGPGRVTVLGEGAAARRIAELLGTVASPVGTRLEDRQLVVCAIEDAPYQTLFEIQRECLRRGVVSLGVTIDVDGIRVGPSVVPGAGPCIACAQIASFRALALAGALKLTGPDLVAAVADFRTGSGSAAGPLEPAVREAVREARALLAADGRPELLTSVRLLTTSGPTTYAVTPAADCPLCGALDRAPADDPQAHAVRRELADRHSRSPRVATAAGDDFCSSIGIVGGGTAGYLTAMALKRKLPGLEVTLIESSAVPVIGVGEATTPLMPQFLHVDLGLDVGELFRRVAPSFKLGIRFAWGTPGGSFNYPFGPLHVLEPAVFDGEVRRCSPRSLEIEAGVVPPASELGVGVAYHLDNQHFVRYLRRKAAGFGVRTVDATISRVEVAAEGKPENLVTGLVAEDGRRFAFDLYVDCSGFRSLLLEQALDSPFLSYRDSLCTDRALVAGVPHRGDVRPYTLAETYNAGWCWSTPQRDADHRGYVFSSSFSSPEDAEREMRRANPGMGDPRLIEFRAGRHQHFWRGNVVAMGNAYGFVEPLESTALHVLIRQIGLLAGAFPIRRGERGVASLLNRKVGAWWDYLRWFLALHYRYNRRLDTPFWRHCRRQTDVSDHGELLELYRERGPLSYQRSALAGIEVPDPLWGAEGVDVLLLGQGVPARLPRPALSRAAWRQRARLYQEVAERGRPQAEALETLDRQPELLERWVADFRRVGPAFG